MMHNQMLLMKVDFALWYLAERARTHRPPLRAPVREVATLLSWHVHTLEDLEIDTMDLWVAYHLLGRREQSDRGRDACQWLAEQLRRVLSNQHTRFRGKTGALMLWSLLARLYRSRPQVHMYRIAAGLLVPGRDRFVLGPAGPRHLYSLPDLITGDRCAAIRDEMRAYYSGDRERDLRPFVGLERLISERQWQSIHRQWERMQKPKPARARVAPNVPPELLDGAEGAEGAEELSLSREERGAAFVEFEAAPIEPLGRLGLDGEDDDYDEEQWRDGNVAAPVAAKTDDDDDDELPPRRYPLDAFPAHRGTA